MPIPATVAWTRLCPGVEHAMGTNHTIPPKYPQQPNVNLLRVDLTCPQVEFFTTPWDQLASGGTKTTEFLRKNFSNGTHEMFATNSNFFDMSMRNTVYGLAASRGQLTSFAGWSQSPYLSIAKNNLAVIGTIDPGEASDVFAGVQDSPNRPWTVVAGNASILHNCNVVTNNQVPPPVAARTAIGLSQATDGQSPRYLYLVTIDGLDDWQQPPPEPPYYGATFQDAAEWLLAAGACEGINLDGGGSSTMARMSWTAAEPELMNNPHDDEGSDAKLERSVGNSFAVIVRQL